MLELAPLEGITTYVFRNAYAHHYGDMERYYTPFLSLHKEKEFNHKERQEILPENNAGLDVVPQVLTNSAEDFLKAAGKLTALGYEEVNINMGCPSGTVTTKAKGAGMLADRARLKAFLDDIFAATPMQISIKTRLGMESAEEWEPLLELFNQYPLAKLIIHARVREDFYQNVPNWQAFGLAVERSQNPVCYNGDIYTVEDYQKLCETFPALQDVMMGRGILRNPALATQIRGSMPGQMGIQAGDGVDKTVTQVGNGVDKMMAWMDNGASDLERLRAFHDEVYAGYQAIQFGDRNILFKMKELWFYMMNALPSGDAYIKKMKKVNSCADYEVLIRQMFADANKGRL